MKRLLYILNLFLLSISLSSCVTIHDEYERLDYSEEIIQIDIFFIPFIENEYITDIPSYVTPIRTFETSQYEEIVNDLESLDYKTVLLIFAASDPNFKVFGYVFKITYASGTYQLVSNSGMGYTYNRSGEYLNSFKGKVKEEVWDELIIKYIGQEEFEKHHLPF